MKDILITNNTSIKFLDKIKESLTKCISCYFSVSFIKKAGLVLFEQELEIETEEIYEDNTIVLTVNLE